MYAALDIGLKEDEERTLSPGMENLLAHMMSAGEGEESHSDKVDTDDEGIEQDHDDFENRGQSPHAPSECLRSTLGLCQSHLSVESEADDHFRNVCRALVSEAMELSFFLEKTYLSQQESSTSEELKLLARKDWVNIINFFAHV
jgi:spire-like protein